MSKVGDRIGALQSATADEVRFFGYGTYQSDCVPPDDVMGPFGRTGLFGIPNPKLVMDDGTVVWGCECWWGPEETIKKKIVGRSVVMVKPERTPATDEERAEAAEISAEAEARAAEAIAEIEANLAKELKP